MLTIEESRNLLTAAGVFFGAEDGDDPRFAQMLNFNDVWGWAAADGEYVPDEELPRVAELFFDYGRCGILYWASERNDHRMSEFTDNNRFIQFVRAEETIRQEQPNSNKRAYLKYTYSIGNEEIARC